VYTCRDGRWVGLTVLDDDGWRALVKEMDAPAWAERAELATADGRYRAHDELDARIAEWARDQVAEALVERLQAAGVAAAVLVEVREVPANVQLRARGFHRRIAHAHVGSQRYPRAPMTFSFGELAAEPAPTLGQHNDEVLRAHGVDARTIATAADELAKGVRAMAGDSS
jgi:crotonobetainyl-CoA:carnitine CoA-transferase CaiB-like acyl-CoA transferase